MKMKKATPAGALLRKDIFRFAPLWGGYFAIGLAVLLFWNKQIEDGYHVLYTVVHFMRTLSAAGIVNAVYAGLVAMLLFGDLFSAKRCEALHAMPIPREKWFFSHLLHGLLYSFVPNLLAMFFVMPMLKAYWYTGLVWLLGMTLQYLFFFGLAVLCVFLSGNHVGMLLFYGVFNLVGAVLQWFVATVFANLLYGIPIADEWLSWLCPVMKILNMIEGTLEHHTWYIPTWFATASGPTQSPGFGPGWGYLVICAGIGVALMGVALPLYRKRKLECAGELLAQKWSKPVFTVLLSLSLGAGLAMLDSFVAADLKWVLLALGLVIGWFGGQMLLHRSVKIFQGKVFLGFAVLAICVWGSIGLAAWDPAGITRYIPEADQVQSVELSEPPKYIAGAAPLKHELTLTDPEGIQRVLQAHAAALERSEEHDEPSCLFTIRYTLKDGKKVTREYTAYKETEVLNAFLRVYSTPRQVLRCEDPANWVESVREIEFQGKSMAQWTVAYHVRTGKTYPVGPYKIKQDYLKALLADCQEGNVVSTRHEKMARYWVKTEGALYGGATFRGLVLQNARHVNAWYEKYRDLFEEG